MMDIERVASGEYPGALAWTELESWAMGSKVSIQMYSLPPPGVYECCLRGNGSTSGSQHGTLRGALYLLYHVVHKIKSSTEHHGAGRPGR